MGKCDVVVVSQVYFFFNDIICKIQICRQICDFRTLMLSSGHGAAKLLDSQFPPRPHKSALKFQQSEPLHPDNRFSRCPVMVLFEFLITVKGNENVLTFSQLSLNRCLAVQQGSLVQRKLYTNAVSYFGSQVLMVISERGLGTVSESEASQISMVISQGISYKTASLLIFLFSIYDHKNQVLFFPP